jgi:4-hydroxy-tetrahydrodipicolinate synthase
MTPDQARLRLTGAMTALVTPFTDGEVDLKQLTTLLNWQIEQGINGLVPCGTTGEAPTLSWEERLDVITLCVRVAGGRVPIIVGTGTTTRRRRLLFRLPRKLLVPTLP